MARLAKPVLTNLDHDPSSVHFSALIMLEDAT